MRRLLLGLQIFGLISVVAGVALLSLPAALIVGGLALYLVGETAT